MSNTNEHDFRSLDPLTAQFRDQQGVIAYLAQENGGYLADLQTAWKAADTRTRQQLRDGQSPTALADCIRYALIHTTIVGNLGRPFPLPSVYGGNNAPLNFESLQSQLPDVERLDNPEQRAKALIEAAAHASDETRDSAVRSAIESVLTIAIDEDYWSFSPELWDTLYPCLIGDRFSEYTHIIFTSPNEVARARFIHLVIRKNNGKLVREALKAAYAIQDPEMRPHALRDLLRHTKGNQRSRILQKLYRSVFLIADPYWKSDLYLQLIRQLKGNPRAYAIRQALATIPSIVGEYRGRYANELMPYLTRAQRSRFLRRVLSVKGAVSRLEACLSLWRYLPASARKQALPLALKVRDLSKRAKYLAQIARRCRSNAAYQEVIDHIVSAIQEIRNEDERRAVIAEIRRYVQDEALDWVANQPVKRLTSDLDKLPGYRFAFAERDRQYVAYALGNLSAYVSKPVNRLSQSLMVDLALEIDLHDYVAEAIERIAPYLDEAYLGYALEGALNIGNAWSRVWALSGLAPYLSGERLETCLNDALDATGLADKDNDSHVGSWFEVDMAARLMPFLKDTVRQTILSKALAIAAQIKQDAYADTRLRFLPFLDAEVRSELVDTIWKGLSQLRDDSARSATLRDLAPYLPVHLVAPALEHAHVFQDVDERQEALSALIPYLPDVQAAMTQAQALEEPYWKSDALVKLLPRLNGEVYAETLELATKITETISAPGFRMDRWLDFHPLVEDGNLIRQKVIESMLDYLWEERNNRRNNILALCAERRYISETILPMEVLSAIGAQVMEICLEWAW